MSQENLLLEDEVYSSDMFSDHDDSAAKATDDSISSTSGNIAEPVEYLPEWKGISLDEILKGFSPFDLDHLPPITLSPNHTVLFKLPLSGRGVPKPYPSQPVDKWNQDYVRLPHSSYSRYPNNNEDASNGFRRRWKVIQEALLQTFYSSLQLEQAIFSYNHKYCQRWDFRALHHFFSTVVDEDEAELFFNGLLPKIIGLALQLPELVTGGIPLLKRHTNASISLSQMQVASLLANAFLCTFPRRNSSNPQSEYANYPHINFNRLFSSMTEKRGNRTQCVMEKLKCIFHYFRRVTAKAPEGTITIQRKYIAEDSFPKWEICDEKLPFMHITSKGTIESEGSGFLQVDFANKFLGGGVMNFGCVQEEIRFVICPELFVTMLVTEALDDTEALVVYGVEQYSKYEGYSDNFQWDGDFVDETPRDNSGRRKTCIVAIDALSFRQPDLQFNPDKIKRELNKAYVGFCAKEMPVENLCAIATGNWGCGAYRGNPKLKVLLQLIAAAVAKRSVVYFTFGDTELRDSVADMYWHLVGQNITIGQLFNMLCDYKREAFKSKNHLNFYHFLYNKARMKDFQIDKPQSQLSLTFIRRPKSKPKVEESKSQTNVPFAQLSKKEKEEVIFKMLHESDDEDEMQSEKLSEKRSLTKLYPETDGHITTEQINVTKIMTKGNKDQSKSTTTDENLNCTKLPKEVNLEKMFTETTHKAETELNKCFKEEMENEKITKINENKGMKNNKSDISIRNLSNDGTQSVIIKKQRKISDFFAPVR